MPQLIKDVSDKLESDPTNTELYNAVATMISNGIHSNGDANGGMALHGMDENSKAYSYAHMWQAGINTPIHDKYVHNGQTDPSLHELTGEGLKDLLIGGGTLADLYTDDKGNISTGWGASGDSRPTAQSKFGDGYGALQNFARTIGQYLT